MLQMKTIANLRRIKLALAGLVFYDDLLQDEKVNNFCLLLAKLTAERLDGEGIYKQYRIFYKSLLGLNWWQYLVNLLFKSHNAFAVQAASQGLKGVDSLTKAHVAADLGIIQDLAEITAGDILALAGKRFAQEMTEMELEIFREGLSPENWPLWPEGSFKQEAPAAVAEAGLRSATEWLETMRESYYLRFIAAKCWQDNVSLLAEYYQSVGFGMFGRYAAFNVRENGQRLEGIAKNDPIRINNLICQEREQAIVLRNTEAFLQGYPANNIILYGNRGTGKSSLVKALLNEYIAQGLRLVQLQKNKISLFPGLVAELAKIPLKFIIFIDDLSFNEEEDDYKTLKSLLEGGVESRPANVLIYATSNRKHLVRESFADRRVDDVHAHDTMEEKLSLADRFGITVTFLSPDQETFLRIVEGLAKQNNITLTKEELRQRALQWVMMHNGRSGRTARQFVDYLLAELRLKKQ
jgi:predicted AAA+ superfamily ATPase